ncbi:MAG: DUF3011 domain-containing protein [Rhizobiales bacterium]|nr:DUF3011 domain-containing protein [Hyphomicrobiales bacterium]
MLPLFPRPAPASLVLAIALVMLPDGSATAGETIKCKSKHNKYTECAAHFKAPILVRQTSRQPCIINSTWGYNPNTRHIWVAAGCNGLFADAHGFHHGAAGSFDKDAHRYNRNGMFVGSGPVVIYNTKVKNVTKLQLDGPGGIGTHHDEDAPKPDNDWQRIPQFDKNGFPNFDTEGNYVGPHGLGALVDAPPECDAGDDVGCN